MWKEKHPETRINMGKTWRNQTKQTYQFYQSSKLNSNFIPKTSFFKSKICFSRAQGPWALESVCLLTCLPSFEVKELGRRLLELHHASCRRHSVNCRVDSVASWFHGNCTCSVSPAIVCVCVPPKNCRGDLKDFCCTQIHSNQMSEIFQVFSRL